MNKHAYLLALLLLLLGCGSNKGTSPDTQATADSAATVGPGKADAAAMQTIVFLGTSLTAGYGLAESQAYPALIQSKLDSAQLPFRTVNAGVSGATSAEGLRRVDWLLKQEMDVLFIELGANDGLRGNDATQTINDLRSNLIGIIAKARQAHPGVSIVLAGMTLPPNFGQAFIKDFEQVFVDVAKTQNATYLPFLLEGVAGEPDLNQMDGIHPTAEGQQIIAQTVWPVLLPVLQARLAAQPPVAP